MSCPESSRLDVIHSPRTVIALTCILGGFESGLMTRCIYHCYEMPGSCAFRYLRMARRLFTDGT